MPNHPLSREDALAAVKALREYGTQSAAAAALGIARPTLQNRLNAAARYEAEDARGAVEKPWRAEPLPSGKEPLEDLLARRRAAGSRMKTADTARALVNIEIRTAGPVGLMFVGDPHVDDDGCDFALLESHLDCAEARRGYLFPVCVGDVTNSWVGRLARLYASQSTTAGDAWRLAEWYTKRLRPMVRIRGNHDEWNKGADPLDYIGRDIEIDIAHGVRMALGHPCGAETRVHVRHDFKGNSQFNGLHGLVRETLWGHRDHILVAGHRHFGEDGAQVTPECITQMVRVSGYKAVDDYAKAGGFKPKRIHPSAVVIVDPSKPETCRSRVWCAPTVEDGVEYLDWLRSRYENGGKLRVKVAS